MVMLEIIMDRLEVINGVLFILIKGILCNSY